CRRSRGLGATRLVYSFHASSIAPRVAASTGQTHPQGNVSGPRSGGHGGCPAAAFVLPVSPMNDVTRILSAIEHGDAHAAEQLLPLVYDELRKLAAQKLAQEWLSACKRDPPVSP